MMILETLDIHWNWKCAILSNMTTDGAFILKMGPPLARNNHHNIT